MKCVSLFTPSSQAGVITPYHEPVVPKMIVETSLGAGGVQF
jgi:hypothetical protein